MGAMGSHGWSFVGAAMLAVLLALCVLWRLSRKRGERARQAAARLAEQTARAARRASHARKRWHTRHPIVLAHGWGCIDRVLPSQLGYSSFRDIPAALRACGHRVHVARVAPTASIELRARQLAQQIIALGEPVNIIAHSMGGLDARLAIARLDLAAHVASLTTIGTPHHGTPLADIALAVGDFRRARSFLRKLGLDMDGIYDLSSARMRAFNQSVPDAPSVLYAHVPAAVERGAVHAMLAGAHRFLARVAGPNDGVVPALSQHWGSALEEIDADHWAQIGWFVRFDVHSFYARLARRLVEREL
jgi:triacylglycerol lipase